MSVGVSMTLRMTNKAKLRWLIVAWVPACCAFFVLFGLIANWLTIISRDEAIRQGMSVPPNWRFVTVGLHGRYSHGVSRRWPFGSINEHPIAFSLCVVLFVGLIVFFVWAKKCGDRLRKKRE